MHERHLLSWTAWPLALLGMTVAVAFAASEDPYMKSEKKSEEHERDHGHKTPGWIGGHPTKGGWIESDERRRDRLHRDRRFRGWPGKLPHRSQRFGKHLPHRSRAFTGPPADRGHRRSDDAAGDPEIVREMWEQTTLDDVRRLFHPRHHDAFDKLFGPDAAVWHDADKRGRPGERARFAAHVLTMLHAMAVQRRAARLFGGPASGGRGHGNPWGSFWILGPEDQEALLRSAEGEAGGPPTPRYLRGLLHGKRHRRRER